MTTIGISLLYIAGKILAKFLLNHLKVHFNKSGTDPRKSMWIQKRQRDNRHDLHSKTASGEMTRIEYIDYETFVDLTKAFDTVSRDGLWRLMVKFGWPPRFMSGNFMMAGTCAK